MIPYKVIIPDKPREQLKKLPKDIQIRMLNKLTEAQTDPFRFFVRLKGRPDYKLRVGDYRASANIKQNDRVIEVTKVGHRKNFYD